MGQKGNSSNAGWIMLFLGASYVLLKKMNNGAFLPTSGAPSNTPESSPTTETNVLSFLSGLAGSVTKTVAKLMNPSQTSFIEKMTPIAKLVFDQYGIHPLIVMTQAAHESGWGTSGLTKKANNLYGYTGDAQLKSWLTSKGLSPDASMDLIRSFDLSTAPFIILQTHEYVSDGTIHYFSRPGDLVSLNGHDATVLRPFRRYDSWQASVQDWVNLLQKPRYAKAWADAKAGNMDQFAVDILEAGYATDPTYTKQLLAMAKTINDIATG